MMNFPIWLVLLVAGVKGWAVVLVVGLVLAALAAAVRGWVRGIAVVLLVPCVGILGLATVLRIHGWQQDRETETFNEAIHEVLTQDRVIDGIALPAGTAVQWWNVDRTGLNNASPPAPVPLFGLRVSFVSQAPDGSGWDLQLPEPQRIEGWTCDRIGVRVSAAGRLLACDLAAGREWRGWPIPGGCFLELAADGAVHLALPQGASMPAPEIGHALTSTGGFSLNADGSLDHFYFADGDPLVVAGLRLWNTVQWTYDPATFGQGRRRRAVSVRGSQLAEDGSTAGDVSIRLADGRVSPE